MFFSEEGKGYYKIINEADYKIPIKEIENVIIIKEIFPVELLMIQMKDTVIISRHSTSMLTDNPSCRYYWTHKLFPKSSLTDQLAIINPTSHIVEVKKINEIL